MRYVYNGCMYLSPAAVNGAQPEDEKETALEEENVGRPKIMARVTKPSKAKPIPPYSSLFLFSPTNSYANHSYSYII